MIYEVRTYRLKPGTLAECERLFGDALPRREEFFLARGVLAYRDRPAQRDHPCLAV